MTSLPSRPPVGYKTMIENGKRIHVPDPKTSLVVRKAFELYLQPSETTKTIWVYLKQAGITTYTGRPLAPSAAHNLLLNSYYMGVISFNGETYQGSRQPIISKQLYEAVQKKLHSKRPMKQRKHDVALRNMLTCGHCGKAITWQLQKGNLYGSCQRKLPECKANKMLRESVVHELLIAQMERLVSPSQEVFRWVVDRIIDEHSADNDSVEHLKQNLNQRITRLENMAEMLYDDKLAGEITKERYDAKKADIQKQLTELRDQLGVAAATTQEVHEDAVEIMELTQHAKAQYTDADMGNDAKRTVLTKLFDEIVYASNSVSVKLSFLAESIAKRSDETRQIMETQKVLNQTAEKDEINRGKINKKDLKNEIYPVWQGLVDDYRTYCDITSFPKENYTT